MAICHGFNCWSSATSRISPALADWAYTTDKNEDTGGEVLVNIASDVVGGVFPDGLGLCFHGLYQYLGPGMCI